ncbi:hypothetical protein [Streptomyces ipomoeae]|uniref:hypothetical protein n=1 Tax=Streptomyces ipomoeae TaxID=103232 RepID=UPI0015F0DEDC|nr:hypothetical protein [Streptomyces ipomoeae]MDX2939611.1 hypothetical protein [Streptomyces ipomoeae]
MHGTVGENDLDVAPAVGTRLLHHREGDLRAGAAVDEPETAAFEHGLGTVAADQYL